MYFYAYKFLSVRNGMVPRPYCSCSWWRQHQGAKDSSGQRFLVCIVIKSSRTRTMNKLIIHSSTVYFLIMHTNPIQIQNMADQRIVKSGGEGESCSTSPCGYTPAWYSRVAGRAAAPPLVRILFHALAFP
jgi:hypothetical protein